MKVNMFERTIVLTKKEMTAASRYGSDAYKALQEARRDYPGYEVIIVTRTVKTQRETYKGLTYEYMERYIKSHDEEGTIWREYKPFNLKPGENVYEDKEALCGGTATFTGKCKGRINAFRSVISKRRSNRVVG